MSSRTRKLGAIPSPSSQSKLPDLTCALGGFHRRTYFSANAAHEYISLAGFAKDSVFGISVTIRAIG